MFYFEKIKNLRSSNLPTIPSKLEDELKAVGAPYTPGRIVEEQ